MPTTTVEHLGPTKAKLTIIVTPDEFKPSIDTAYREIAAQVNVPGFRRGKVPAPVIDRRIGRGAVLQQAVGSGIDTFFQEAITEHRIRPLGRPSADVLDWPSEQDFSGDLRYTVEVDVRPTIALPKFEDVQIEVPGTDPSEEEIVAELDRLRVRFGTLVPVERAARTGDFVTIDLVAAIEDAEVDRADGVSYELGSGELIAGLDDALDSLTTDEETTFASTLVGGTHAGQSAEVTVRVRAVRERELPALDDDFAQTASEFDTLEELRANVRTGLEQRGVLRQSQEARERLITTLIDTVEVPLIDSLIEEEVRGHLENEGRLDDEEHRAEATEEAIRNYRTQIIVDTIVDAEGVQVSQEELAAYVMQAATQRGVAPAEFMESVGRSGQLGVIVGEVARAKALAQVLGRVRVVDPAGQRVDMSALLGTGGRSGGTRSVEVDAVATEPVSDEVEAASADQPQSEDDAPVTKRTRKRG